ncbi:hypothetical protein RVR_6942 [Actinacidiphila reveromycinica]|uniref:Uncharacterized protein n=1 Tax=Actinacidiphila reveromycinica TaxID=659352 RepID=A0A7U3UWU7_9ACTN|nr:hypothetical protein RVR_6942 [Streptomyces sp. SN-593]
MTLALTLGGVGAAAATSIDTSASTTQAGVIHTSSDTASGTTTDADSTHTTLSPATWYPPA